MAGMRAIVDLIGQDGYNGLVATSGSMSEPVYFTTANFHRDLTDLLAWSTAIPTIGATEGAFELDFGSSVQQYRDNPIPNIVYKSVFGTEAEKSQIAIGTYMIAAGYVEKVQKEIATLNRKAAKIGAPLVSMIEGRPYVHTYLHVDPMMIYPSEERHIEVVDVTILGAAPMIAGWQFVATIQHGVVADEAEGHAHVNVIAALPNHGFTIPTEYWTIEPICQHCGYKRRRNDTYLLRNIESGEWKQVGSTCLGDFTGINNPQAIARSAEWWATLEEKMKGYREGDGHAPVLFPIKTYLRFALLSVKEGGWVSRGKADEYGKPATADDAMYTMQDYAKDRKDNPTVRRLNPELLASFTPEVEAMLAWLKTQHRNMPLAAFIQQHTNEWFALSDYMRNLLTACMGDFIKPKHIGLVASLIPAYRKAMDMIRERAARPASSHVGTVGEKVTVKVECVLVRGIDSQYGMTTLHKFVDEQGNQFTWFASRETLEMGQWYQVTGTVKAHEVYKDQPQTTLTRCKVTPVGGDDPTPPAPEPQPVQQEMNFDVPEQPQPQPEQATTQPKGFSWYYPTIAEFMDSNYSPATLPDVVYEPHFSGMEATFENVVDWTLSVAAKDASRDNISFALVAAAEGRKMKHVWMWWLDRDETQRVLVIEDEFASGQYRAPVEIEAVLLKQMVIQGAMSNKSSQVTE